MALKDAWEEVKQFKLDQLDPNNIGAWPVAIKGLVLALLALVVLGLGFFLVVKDQRKELAKQVRTEVDLRGQFQQKAFEAHNIDALRHQSEGGARSSVNAAKLTRSKYSQPCAHCCRA